MKKIKQLFLKIKSNYKMILVIFIITFALILNFTYIYVLNNSLSKVKFENDCKGLMGRQTSKWLDFFSTNSTNEAFYGKWIVTDKKIDGNIEKPIDENPFFEPNQVIEIYVDEILINDEVVVKEPYYKAKVEMVNNELKYFVQVYNFDMFSDDVNNMLAKFEVVDKDTIIINTGYGSGIQAKREP